MDPDEALRQIRECLEDYRRAENHDNPEAVSLALARLAEITDGLDAWISKGGFLPRAWRKLRTLTKKEGQRVARVTYAASHPSAPAVDWHELKPEAREYWAGIASVAIGEYLSTLDYRLIPVGDTNEIVPGRQHLS